MRRRFLIVEDHPLVADAVRQTLVRLAPGARCQIAHNLAQACAVLQQHQSAGLSFDGVVTDVQLPDAQGEAVLLRLLSYTGAARTVVYSGMDWPWMPQFCAQHGLVFVSKTDDVRQLCTALLDTLAAPLAMEAQPAHWVDRPADNEPVHPIALLTARQRDVLQAVSRGLTNREIGQGLHMSEETVRTHLAHIFKRLDVKNRTQAGNLFAQWHHAQGY